MRILSVLLANTTCQLLIGLLSDAYFKGKSKKGSGVRPAYEIDQKVAIQAASVN
jgi:hypothetical protein